MHTESHPRAGQEVVLEGVTIDGQENPEYFIEDWWDKLTGGSWQFAQGNPAALKYAIRSVFGVDSPLPIDDEVVYGKIDGFGHLVHVSELP